MGLGLVARRGWVLCQTSSKNKTLHILYLWSILRLCNGKRNGPVIFLSISAQKLQGNQREVVPVVGDEALTPSPSGQLDFCPLGDF